MTIHEFLQGDKFALLAGVELLETGNGYAKARMLIKPEHLNGGGVCQGGAIFTLADLAFAAVSAVIRPLSAILLFPAPAYPFTGPIITRIPAMIPQKILFPALMLFLPPSLLSRRISPYKIWSGHSLLCHCLQNA